MRYEKDSYRRSLGRLVNGVLGIALAPRTRRVVQAVAYELIAIAMVTPAIAFFFDEGQGSALGLSVLMSSIALAWNYAFNAVFEWWEQRQTTKGRSALRRLPSPVSGSTRSILPDRLSSDWTSSECGSA